MVNPVEKVFNEVCAQLPHTPCDGLWTPDDEEILSESEDQIESLADTMDEMFGNCTSTGYYDPEEDARNGETNERTGYYYLTLCD